MAITGDQTSRTEALAIDYGLKFYTAAHADVDETAFTADDTYSPDGSWTEITAKVAGPVRFSNSWSEGQAIIDWRATVSGTLYDSSDLAHERLMLAMHRLWCVATGWTSWVVWWCGYIEKLPGHPRRPQGRRRVAGEHPIAEPVPVQQRRAGAQLRTARFGGRGGGVGQQCAGDCGQRGGTWRVRGIAISGGGAGH